MPILYKLAAAHPISHFVEIEMHVSDIDSDEVIFQLPSWRPGRYEIANFAKNVRKWRAVNNKNEALAFRKLNKDSWSVSTDGAKQLIIKYEYYCAQLDAGACWVDDEQIYINPVHCFLFIHDRIHEECIVELKLPANYRIATSLQKSGERILLAEDYDELVDSPFIASSTLQVKSYEASGINFSIAIQGDTQPDWPRILADFKAFSEKQIEIMGSFPVEEYIVPCSDSPKQILSWCRTSSFYRTCTRSRLAIDE
jgi:predicted metalloprotease with PDZ domain